MAESSAPSEARSRVIWLVAGIVVLNAAIDVVFYSLNPESLKTDVMRLGAIALAGLLVVRGARWARILLAVLTGLTAAFAALLAITAPMSLPWRIVYLGYGIGTLWCLTGLFRSPAEAFFVTPAEVTKGGA